MNLRDIQNSVQAFSKGMGIIAEPEIRMLDLTSEVGELSKEILKGTDYGKKPLELTEAWKEEIGDVLFSLICIANETDIDLESCLKLALDKYQKRYEEIGNLGSGK